jgi:hypothetical protein
VIAEHVLAAGQYRATGDIRLRALPGGFGTTRPLGDGAHARVVADRLVVSAPDGDRSVRLTTVADAAAFLGVESGLPEAAYPAATTLRPDVPLGIDEPAARVLADWYDLGDKALRQFAAELGGTDEPVLWPEHFDLGIVAGAVNYGASPGDTDIPEPYLYVGPHDWSARRDEFWNAVFGAARTRDDIKSVDAALAFFREGRTRAAAVAG